MPVYLMGPKYDQLSLGSVRVILCLYTSFLPGFFCKEWAGWYVVCLEKAGHDVKQIVYITQALLAWNISCLSTKIGVYNYIYPPVASLPSL